MTRRLSTSASALVLAVAATACNYTKALRNSCQDHGGSWGVPDLVVDELRRHDPRWGYNGNAATSPGEAGSSWIG